MILIVIKRLPVTGREHWSGAEPAVLPLGVKAHFYDIRSLLRSAHVTFRPAPLRFRSAHTNSLHQCKLKHNFTTLLYSNCECFTVTWYRLTNQVRWVSYILPCCKFHAV